MKSYCLKCRKNTENINTKVSKKAMVEHWHYQNVQYVVAKKSRLTKNQEAKGLLSKVVVRAPLSEVPILGDIFF